MCFSVVKFIIAITRAVVPGGIQWEKQRKKRKRRRRKK